MIPGTDFDSLSVQWVGSTNLLPEEVEAFVGSMTALRDQEIMGSLPDQPTGYKVIKEEAHQHERALEALFPWKAPPKSIPISNAVNTTN